MTVKQILTIVASLAAGASGVSQVSAQTYYPSATVQSPTSYGNRDRMPNFDALDEEDEMPSDRRRVGTLPPPGPVMSPDDPRYGRPMNAPVYSDRMPQGQIAPADDPRYVRPTDDQRYVRPADDPRYARPAAPPPAYSDGGPPAPSSVQDAMLRPPQGVGATGSVPPQQGGSNQPMSIAALPPEDQPETGEAQLDPRLRRQEVAFQTNEPAGTLVVDTPNTYLYYVLGGGRAIRYGVRVGRDGFTWNGVQKITRKAEWPDWHPPTEMIERQPYLPRFMAGGPGNPLGARAMYLGSTVYRIHGTNQPSTIGKFVSSGCIGMLNEDVSDLFERVKVGTRVVVLPGSAPASTPVASAQPVQQMPPAQSAANVPGTAPPVMQPLPAPVTIR